MVEIKLQFKTPEEAVMALGKMAGLGAKVAPQAPAAATGSGNDPTVVAAAPSTQATTKARKPRADAGQARGPNARTQPEAKAGGVSQPAAQPNPSDGVSAATTTAPVIPPAAASAPETAAPAPVEADKAQPPGATPDAAAPATIEQCQAALTEVFEKKGAPIAMAVLSRFGTKRIKEMLPVSYADFITKCNAVLAGEEV